MNKLLTKLDDDIRGVEFSFGVLVLKAASSIDSLKILIS